MHTELASPIYRGLDTWPVQDVLSALWQGQRAAVAACEPVLPQLENAVGEAGARLGAGGGRLIYAGAGSAGLIAALDALDLGATFSWPEERTAILLAGGLDLALGLQAPNEDDPALGCENAAALALGERDVVIGVSASGASAFTVAVLEEAARKGALTIAVTGDPRSPLAAAASLVIAPDTGAEVIAGSTRLGAGTAQKVVLNLFSTALMVRLCFVHDNLMVEARPENDKLRRRCAAMVGEIASVPQEQATGALARYGTVKRAVLGLAGVAETEIDALLACCGNNLRRALVEAAKGRR